MSESEMNNVHKLETDIKKLQAEISKIQNNCSHDFEVVNKLKLQETLVKGVFVGSTAGPVKVGYSETSLLLKCRNCFVEISTNISRRCPKCLSDMVCTAECLGADSRLKYFGNDHLYYSIRLNGCSKCDFAVASDEWDQ